MTNLDQAFLELQRSTNPGVVVSGKDAGEQYLGDWTIKNKDARLFAVALPRTVEDVSGILKFCNEQRIPVATQGGRTGLAGGAVPGNGWLALSLERMRAIEDADTSTATVVVEAGAILQSVQQAADAAGMLFALDIAGRGSCTIGGNIATNAGGNHVVRYGMMRDLVLGLEVVLANGTILTSMNKMLKNNTGYDLKQLFIGSEGTLGVITKAVLKLSPKSQFVQTGLCSVKSYAEVVELLKLAKSSLGNTMSAFEVMWPSFYQLATTKRKKAQPLPEGAGFYVLIEAAANSEVYVKNAFELFVEQAADSALVEDAVIAPSLSGRQKIWDIRDSAAELQVTMGPYIAFDVSLPIDKIGVFAADCERHIDSRWPNIGQTCFGHVGDSNIHIVVCSAHDQQQIDRHELDTIVYDQVAKYNGSISAEHGIGLLKKDFLNRSRTTAEIATMKLIKSTLDPERILNPDKIFI